MTTRTGVPGPTKADVPSTADAARWVGAWAAALDRLEMDVEATEQLLSTVHSHADLPLARPGEWTPPQGLGPLPTSLRERAEALLARQIETAHRVSAELATNRRHVAATANLGRQDVTRPLFVDKAL